MKSAAVECSRQVSILIVGDGVMREGCRDPEFLLLPELERPCALPIATAWANVGVFGEVAGVLTRKECCGCH